MIRPLGPETVGEGGATLEVAHTPTCKRGQLMDDHIRPRLTHDLLEMIGIERVSDDRLRLAACHAMDLMPRRSQTRDQLLSNRPCVAPATNTLIVDTFVEEHLRSI